MLIYSIQDIASIIQAQTVIVHDASIAYLLVDSRKIVFPNTSLFFALTSERRDGHDFIEEVYERGIRNFVVKNEFDAAPFPNANFLLVDDTLDALQQLAAHHRSQFNIPVIGITGSNGKTIVKEWLYHLLSPDYNIVRSPRSYNSQIGVPLSVWQMDAQHTLGIFEAGISEIGEMGYLEKIIQPTIGVFTNIGDAHNEGFVDCAQKIEEKLQLFPNCKILIGKGKDLLPQKTLSSKFSFDTWGFSLSNEFVIKSIQAQGNHSNLIFEYKEKAINFNVPFIDNASVENSITCICLMLNLGYGIDTINERIALLEPVEMRMQLKKGNNNSTILNDSYSNDISSLSIALDYLMQQSGNQPTTVILSDILQSGLKEDELYQQVAQELEQRKVAKFIGIGQQLSKHQLFFSNIPSTTFYNSTEVFLQQNSHSFKDEYVLLKGARAFAFERISRWLEHKVHQTVMEINLTAMVHNLKQYQQLLKPATKLMAMVKAFSYGSGSAEVARLLQFHKVDYLAVAYADEGIELRKAGINLPIMIMNADEAGFDALIEYNLEPEIYCFNMYHSFHQYLLQQGIAQFPVHIKLNTGMNRLGFDVDEVPELGKLLKQNNSMAIKSVFSHLTSSDLVEQDDFTKCQANLFNDGCTILQNSLGYTFIKHLANTAAIFRHPNLQYDMVRLGIGLYGVDSANGKNLKLETVATLKSTIAQVRMVKANDTIGYSRKGKALVDSKVAIVRIGYADGFSRRLSNGVGSIYVQNQLAPVIGNVCMDMAMIDVTNIPNVNEGNEVEIFGRHLSVEKLAEWSSTISYEILTSISQRVKRVYVEE
ncbi:MAG: bifunctional UDP-N-acetylmuramoyl-tripeptide:D-alanyl-D-alanine ligase/alanine racemase [Chitinophagaceae bacterium]|nr:bifunctional UDP-N-acetylmuramoyl-tripeptide:D-alanyl-D-alanine ligase/alanine racemase [Chitinophagaceae bacterium]